MWFFFTALIVAFSAAHLKMGVSLQMADKVDNKLADIEHLAVQRFRCRFKVTDFNVKGAIRGIFVENVEKN